MAYRDYDEGYRSRQHGREFEGSTFGNEQDNRLAQRREQDEFPGASYGRGRENDWRDREYRGGSRPSGFGEDWQGGRYHRAAQQRDDYGRSFGGGMSGGREWNEGRFSARGRIERGGSVEQDARSSSYYGGEPSRYGRDVREYDYDYAGPSEYGHHGQGSSFGRYDESGREFERSERGETSGELPHYAREQERYAVGGYGPSTGTGYGTARSYLGSRSEYWGGSASMRPNFVGRGPRSYKRSEDRIREEINERLTRHPEIDASDVDVRIENYEVVLSGVVEDRKTKRLAEDIAEEVWGVEDVRNELKVRHGFLASLTGERADDREVQRTTAREGAVGAESKDKTGRTGGSSGGLSPAGTSLGT